MGHFVNDSSGKSFEPVGEGVHLARCYSIIDLGTTHNERWNKDQNNMMFTWEIPSIRIEIEKDGETKDLPRVISKKYNLVFAEKAHLRKDIQSWLGRMLTSDELAQGFDLKSLLGIYCQLQVLHNKTDVRTYANIQNIIPVPKGMPLPEPENPLAFFSFQEDAEIPEGVPNWMVDLIQKSNEWTALMRPADYVSEEDKQKDAEHQRQMSKGADLVEKGYKSWESEQQPAGEDSTEGLFDKE